VRLSQLGELSKKGHRNQGDRVDDHAIMQKYGSVSHTENQEGINMSQLAEVENVSEGWHHAQD
jgi:hypothetical protein